MQLDFTPIIAQVFTGFLWLLPLFLLMVVMVLLMYFVPGIATWLPQQISG